MYFFRPEKNSALHLKSVTTKIFDKFLPINLNKQTLFNPCTENVSNFQSLQKFQQIIYLTRSGKSGQKLLNSQNLRTGMWIFRIQPIFHTH